MFLTEILMFRELNILLKTLSVSVAGDYADQVEFLENKFRKSQGKHLLSIINFKSLIIYFCYILSFIFHLLIQRPVLDGKGHSAVEVCK